MKLLYCILAICVAVNAEPAPPTREQLENLVKLILQNVEDAPESIDKVIASTVLTVEKKLLENKLIQKVKCSFEEKLSERISSTENEDSVSDSLLECSISIIKGYKKLAVEINKDLLQKLVNEGYGKQGDYLSILKKDLSELKDALENHADKEIESCLDGKRKCKLTHEFLSKSEEYFAFQDIMQHTFETYVQSSHQYFNSVEVENKIVADFTHPAYQCLNEQ